MQEGNEKVGMEHIEVMQKTDTTLPGEPSTEHVDQVDTTIERKVRNKCDWNLMPVLFILLLLSFLDRVNIGNA